MARSIREVLVHSAVDHFVGRDRELARLAGSLGPSGHLVNFVHGIGGIGKSSLLNALAAIAREDGIPVISIDCREVEPSEHGILDALQGAIGGVLATPVEAGQRLSELGHCVLLVFDSYEVFRLVDTWVRQVFIPALGDNLRIVLVGREPPVSGWKTRAGWESLFCEINLQPLDEAQAQALLKSLGLSGRSLARINRYAKGNPLALRLAASAASDQPTRQLEDINNEEIIPRLTQLYLEDVPDAGLRQALEATSVIRRITQSVLAVLLPDNAPQDIFERLARLPFVTRGRDGLVVHEIVRQAIAENLHAVDPSRYVACRNLAYRQYRRELQTVSPEDVWRYTADFLYLIEMPLVRDAFFPSDQQAYSIEGAQPGDHAEISRIARRHESTGAVGLTDLMLERIPRAFRVVRGHERRIEGYYIAFDPNAEKTSDIEFDPVMRRWMRHLERHPVPQDQRALFIRRWIGAEHGELPSPVQAACWLDVKGDYVRMRSVLRRVYTGAIEAGAYAPVLQRLGFEMPPQMAAMIDSTCFRSAILDFGPGLFLGWLDGLVRAALQTGTDLLDLDARELVVGHDRIGLTPLEFGVIAYLSDHEGKAVSRDSLLDHVWGRDYHGGSNVVDARIRDLRRKLGPLSTTIETVTGVGYRFRHPAR